MPLQAKKIIVSYTKETVYVNYWAGGNGRKMRGYLTSFRQLQSRLDKYFHSDSLDLYTFINRKLVHITSDSRLKQALGTTSSGEYLLVHAFGHRKAHHITKLPEFSPITITRHVEPKAAFRSKRSPNAAPKADLQKRLERMFPAWKKTWIASASTTIRSMRQAHGDSVQSIYCRNHSHREPSGFVLISPIE